MENIQEKIAQIMSDPQALDQVQSLGKMLGLNRKENEIPPKQEQSAESVELMSKIGRLMPLFQRINQEDDTTRLLLALKPFLSEEKCKKLDSAKKMVQMMKLIPLLKESGFIDLGIF